MDDLEINDHVEPSVFGEEDEDPFANIPPPLAPLPSAGDETGDFAVQNGVLNLDDENETGEQEREQNKKKKRVTRPRINLNDARLCSVKGISALKNLCADVQFKGKGHEASDLNKLLQRYEHWAQCLMPCWPFENVVDQCEKLGAKKSVQNELKRLRYNEDEILRGGSDDEHEEATTVGETATVGEQPLEQAQPDGEAQVPAPETPVQLTEEQLEQIRKNRELAFARREAIKRRKLLEQSQARILETGENFEEHNENGAVNPTTAAGGSEDDVADNITVPERKVLDGESFNSEENTTAETVPMEQMQIGFDTHEISEDLKNSGQIVDFHLPNSKEELAGTANTNGSHPDHTANKSTENRCTGESYVVSGEAGEVSNDNGQTDKDAVKGTEPGQGTNRSYVNETANEVYMVTNEGTPYTAENEHEHRSEDMKQKNFVNDFDDVTYYNTEENTTSCTDFMEKDTLAKNTTPREHSCGSKTSDTDNI